MTANALSLVGLALKAGKIEIGEEPVGNACRAHKAEILLLAFDAAENSIHRAERFAEEGNISCVTLPFTKAELGYSLGRASCAMVAFTDAGLAASLMSKLAATDPERYGSHAEALKETADKENRRRKEQRAHERRVQKLKQKPWAAPAPGKKSGSPKKQ